MLSLLLMLLLWPCLLLLIISYLVIHIASRLLLKMSMDRNNTDISPAMLASRRIDNILHQIQTSNLNFYLQLSPFCAHISPKKTLIRDKYGSYLCPAVFTSKVHSPTDLLHEVAAAHATIKVLEDEMNQLNPIQGGGQKRLRAPSLLNFDKNNHRMRL